MFVCHTVKTSAKNAQTFSFRGTKRLPVFITEQEHSLNDLFIKASPNANNFTKIATKLLQKCLTRSSLLNKMTTRVKQKHKQLVSCSVSIA